MITTTMSYNEIIEELEKDISNLERYTSRIVGGNKYYKAALKRDKPFNFKPLFWTSSRKNNYIISPYSLGKAETRRQQRIVWSERCYYFDRHNKLNLTLMCPETSNNAIITSHFFDRYAERFLKDDSLGKIEVMVEFTKRNRLISGITLEFPGHENSVFLKCDDGIILGTRINDNLNEFKTFLTTDMLKGFEFDAANECADLAENHKIDIKRKDEERAKLIKLLDKIERLYN